MPFDMVEFSVSSAGTFNFLSTDVSPSNWDNYTFLYAGSFNSASPMSNLLIGNDDFGHAGNQGLSGFSYALQPGVDYFFVTAGYYASSVGSFTNNISLSAVPEPGTWALVGVSFVGLAATWRLRRRTGIILGAVLSSPTRVAGCCQAQEPDAGLYFAHPAGRPAATAPSAAASGSGVDGRQSGGVFRSRRAMRLAPAPDTGRAACGNRDVDAIVDPAVLPRPSPRRHAPQNLLPLRWFILMAGRPFPGS